MTSLETFIAALHDICMEYPGTEEIWEGSVGAPVWKVNGKIFAMQHGMDGQPSLWMKAPPGVQDAVVSADPSRFFRPPYVGHNGWVGTWLNETIVWPEIEDLIDDSWRMTAKKAQIRELDSQRREESAS